MSTSARHCVALSLATLLRGGCPEQREERTGASLATGYVIPITVTPELRTPPGHGAYFREAAGAATTTLSISNLGTSGETVTVEFSDAAGVRVDAVSEHVNAGALWRFDTSSRLALAGQSGTFRVSSPSGVDHLLVQASVDILHDGGGVAYVVPVMVSSASEPELGHGAYFAEAAGEATTLLRITNLGTAGETVTVEFSDAAGALVDSTSAHLNAGSLWLLETRSRPALAGRSGTFRVAAPGGLDDLLVQGSVDISRRGGGVASVAPVTVTAAPALEPGHGAYFAEAPGEATTTVRITNLGNSGEVVLLAYWDADGVPVDSVSERLDPGELWRLETSARPSLAGQRGTFQVRSPSGAVSLLVQADVAMLREDGSVSQVVPVTVSPARGAPAGHGAFFAQGGGAATTTLSISNLGTSAETVTVAFADATGVLVDSVSEHVNAGALWRFDTSSRLALAGRSGTFRVSSSGGTTDLLVQAEFVCAGGHLDGAACSARGTEPDREGDAGFQDAPIEDSPPVRDLPIEDSPPVEDAPIEDPSTGDGPPVEDSGAEDVSSVEVGPVDDPAADVDIEVCPGTEDAGAVTILGSGSSSISARSLVARSGWVAWGDGTSVRLAPGDGASEARTVFSGAAVAVAIDGRHLYWLAGETTGSIQRATLDEWDPNQETVGTVHASISYPRGLAVDGDRMYWFSNSAIDTWELRTALVADTESTVLTTVRGAMPVRSPVVVGSGDERRVYWERYSSFAGTCWAVESVEGEPDPAGPRAFRSEATSGSMACSSATYFGIGATSGGVVFHNPATRRIGSLPPPLELGAGRGDGTSVQSWRTCAVSYSGTGYLAMPVDGSGTWRDTPSAASGGHFVVDGDALYGFTNDTFYSLFRLQL